MRTFLQLHLGSTRRPQPSQVGSCSLAPVGTWGERPAPIKTIAGVKIWQHLAAGRPQRAHGRLCSRRGLVAWCWFASSPLSELASCVGSLTPPDLGFMWLRGEVRPGLDGFCSACHGAVVSELCGV